MAWPPVIPPANRANATPQVDNHPGDHNAISQALTDLVTRVAPTAWTALPFGPTWSNVGAPNSPGSYRKVGDIVYLRGVVQSTAPPNTTIATLPVGFRPPTNDIFNAWAFTSATGAYRIDILASGVLQLQGGISGAVSFLSLAQLSWSTV